MAEVEKKVAVPLTEEEKKLKKQKALKKRESDVENALQAFENVFLVKNPQRLSLLKSMVNAPAFKLTKGEFDSAVESKRLNANQVKELTELGFVRTYAVSTGTGRVRDGESHSQNLAPLIAGTDKRISEAATRVQNAINKFKKENQADLKLVLEEGKVNVQFYVRDLTGKNKRTNGTAK